MTGSDYREMRSGKIVRFQHLLSGWPHKRKVASIIWEGRFPLERNASIAVSASEMQLPERLS